MKTILSRMKTLIVNNKVAGSALFYVRHVEIIHPELGMTVISTATLPSIFLTPVSTTEVWTTTQRKEAVSQVIAYLILSYHQRETSIMGDSSRPGGHGKGITDFVIDFLDVFRGHRLAVDGTNYLDKPLDIRNINYIREDLGDNAHIIVAEISMEASRLFLQSSLPGDI